MFLFKVYFLTAVSQKFWQGNRLTWWDAIIRFYSVCFFIRGFYESGRRSEQLEPTEDQLLRGGNKNWREGPEGGKQGGALNILRIYLHKHSLPWPKSACRGGMLNRRVWRLCLWSGCWSTPFWLRGRKDDFCLPHIWNQKSCFYCF